MITHKVFIDQQLVSVHFSGDITFEDLVAWHDEIFADPEYKLGFDGLFDYRNCQYQVSNEEIKELAKIISSSHKVSGKSVHLTRACSRKSQ